MRTLAALVLGVLALPGGPLAANLPILGGQVSLVLPQGDLNGGKGVHGREGLGGGLHGTFDLDGGHALNLRGAFAQIREGRVNILTYDGSTQLYAEEAKVRSLALALDYCFFLSSNPAEGPYFLIGLGQQWIRSSGAHLVPGGVGPDVAWPAEHSNSTIQYALGLGHKFRPHLGGEFRFTQGNFKNVALPWTSMKTPTFTVSLTLDY